MKKAIYILSILILFQSCYSYKTFDIKDYETVKPKKVKIELKNSKKYKGKVLEFKNDTFLLESSKGIIEINSSEIEEIKKRRFSILKTYLLSSTISLGVLMILLKGLSDNLFNGLKVF